MRDNPAPTNIASDANRGGAIWAAVTNLNFSGVVIAESRTDAVTGAGGGGIYTREPC